MLCIYVLKADVVLNRPCVIVALRYLHVLET